MKYLKKQKKEKNNQIKVTKNKNKFNTKILFINLYYIIKIR